ncbi:AAA family ATPase [uncultured Limosilactobacillus sp.]|uniref:ATP-binding protein n=1 Tax=uncultured Limosilactobacillus sp. TaxID=2837629 RepID=UPI0025DCFE5B|nr:AAA family ATPase [uncultured Limosilactobacillus sp.]
MKILQIKIDGFGRWINADIQLDSSLQVFFGPNEAGKSTLVEFIKGVLFGFKNAQGKNKYKQYVPKATAAYGGSLLVEQDGQRYWVHRSGRRQGGQVTISHEDGSRTTMTIEKLCGPLNRQLVEDIFVFGQGELSRIDDLSDEELRQDLQRVGAVGSAHWQAVKADLQKQSRDLYKARGRKPELNQALTKVKDLQQRLTTAQEKTTDYRQLVHQQATIRHQAGQVDQQLTAARHQLEQLKRQQQLWPVFEEWQGIQNRHGALEQLSASDLTRVQQLQASLPEIERQVKSVEEAAAATKQQVADLSSDGLNLYRQKWQGANDPTAKLRSLQLEQLAHEQQRPAADKAQQTLTDVQKRLGKDDLPAPLTVDQRSQLVALLQPASRQDKPSQRWSAAISVALSGGAALLLGLVMKSALLDIIGIIVLLIGVVLAYQQQQKVSDWQRQTERESQQRHQALADFGQQHGLAAFDQDQWLSMQADLEKAAAAQQTLHEFDQAGDQLGAAYQQWQAAFTNINADNVTAFWNQTLNYLRTCQQQAQRQDELNRRQDEQQRLLSERRQQLAKQRADLTAFYQRVGAHNQAEFQQYLEQRTAAQNEAATKSAAEVQLTPAMREQLSQYAGKDDLVAQVGASTQEVNSLLDHQQQLTRQAEEIKVQLKSLVEDWSVTRLEQELANAEQAARSLAKKWLTEMLTSQWIDSSLALASADRYPQIIQRATKYFAILTNDRYQTIQFDNDQLVVAGPAGRQFAVGELSTGTAEQLYVALRLGFVSVMNDTVQFPLVIDDGFVNFDNDRKVRVLDLLKQAAKSGQVIYLTADDRILATHDLSVTNLEGSQDHE